VAALQRQRPENPQAFVAMWFNPETDDAWKNGFYPAIKCARYHPMRIDSKEFNNKIDDEIVVEIKRSHFLVADFTGHRQAVYFETGFAMGLGLPVIFTCHKKYLKKCDFDTRQYNHIVWEWESLDDLRKRLRNRIVATIGLGSAPPSTACTNEE
jgi:nucleoside 2-deoxyribosyltransferase